MSISRPFPSHGTLRSLAALLEVGHVAGAGDGAAGRDGDLEVAHGVGHPGDHRLGRRVPPVAVDEGARRGRHHLHRGGVPVQGPVGPVRGLAGARAVAVRERVRPRRERGVVELEPVVRVGVADRETRGPARPWQRAEDVTARAAGDVAVREPQLLRSGAHDRAGHGRGDARVHAGVDAAVGGDGAGVDDHRRAAVRLGRRRVGDVGVGVAPERRLCVRRDAAVGGGRGDDGRRRAVLEPAASEAEDAERDESGGEEPREDDVADGRVDDLSVHELFSVRVGWGGWRARARECALARFLGECATYLKVTPSWSTPPNATSVLPFASLGPARMFAERSTAPKRMPTPASAAR